MLSPNLNVSRLRDAKLLSMEDAITLYSHR
jgi:hypothetical protein